MSHTLALWCYNEKHVTQLDLDRINNELGIHEYDEEEHQWWNIFYFETNEYGEFFRRLKPEEIISFKSTGDYPPYFSHRESEYYKQIFDCMRKNMGTPHVGSSGEPNYETIPEFTIQDEIDMDFYGNSNNISMYNNKK